MCKPKSEGGQRCYSHMSKKWDTAVDQYEKAEAQATQVHKDTRWQLPNAERRSLRSQAYQSVSTAHEAMMEAGIGLVSTPKGKAQIEQMAADAAAQDDQTRVKSFNYMLREGERRERVAKDTTPASAWEVVTNGWGTGVVAGF